MDFLKISDKLKLSLIELTLDKDMDFRTWLGIFAGVGSNNLQKIDDFALDTGKTIDVIKNTPSTVFLDCKKQTIGIYKALVPSILPDKTDLINDGIYIVKLDVTNETTSVSLRINDTIGKILKKVTISGMLSDFDIGDIQSGQEYICKYNGQFLVLINTDAFTFMNRQISEFVLKEEVVDNLTSVKTDVPLSANQGKVLSNIIQTKIDNLKGGVGEDGNTLKKLRDLIQAIQTLLNSDDINLDELQEIVNYIKSNKDLIDQITINKINISDIINSLVSTDTDKPLSANMGKTLDDKVVQVASSIGNHINDFKNPHKITKAHLKIEKVENTADDEKNVFSATKLTTARNINNVLFDATKDIVIEDNTKIPTSQKGVARGIATLNENGVIPSTQLPSSILEKLSKQFVDELPLISDAKANTIYMVLKTDTSNSDYRDEYILDTSATPFKFEFVGTTKVDLTDYITTNQLNTAIEKKADNLIYTENKLQLISNNKPIGDEITIDGGGGGAGGFKIEDGSLIFSSTTQGSDSVFIDKDGNLIFKVI